MSRSPKPNAPSTGKAAVKRNRFIKLTGATKSVNRELEAKTRALAGWKGYTTNLTDQTAEFVIGAYHQLWRIEKSFRMSKHDLQARPIYHHTRESIEAHLTHRVRRPGRQPLDRTPNRLEHQEIRPHRTPLPHRQDPSRTTNTHRRRTHYPTTSLKPSPKSAAVVRTSLIKVGSDETPHRASFDADADFDRLYARARRRFIGSQYAAAQRRGGVA